MPETQPWRSAVGAASFVLLLAIGGCDLLGPGEDELILIEAPGENDCISPMCFDWEWSPDGKSVVYWTATGWGEPRPTYQIRIRDLDSGSDRSLLEGFDDDRRLVEDYYGSMTVTRRYVYFRVRLGPAFDAGMQLYRVPLGGGSAELLLDELGSGFFVQPDDRYLFAKPSAGDGPARQFRLDTRTWENALPTSVNHWRGAVFDAEGRRAITPTVGAGWGGGAWALVLDLPAGDSIGYWRPDNISSGLEVRRNAAWRAGQPYGFSTEGGSPGGHVVERNMFTGEVRTALTLADNEYLYHSNYVSVSPDARSAAFWVRTCNEGDHPNGCWARDMGGLGELIGAKSVRVVGLPSGRTLLDLPKAPSMSWALHPWMSPDGCRVAVPHVSGGVWIVRVPETCS
jgi:hypothetical protein